MICMSKVGQKYLRVPFVVAKRKNPISKEGGISNKSEGKHCLWRCDETKRGILMAQQKPPYSYFCDLIHALNGP